MTEAQQTRANPVTLLGLGAMGTALARTWLAAGHPLTVWNRTAARAEALVAEGAKAAATPAEAVAASPLIVVCLLDEASVTEALADVDLTGKDLVDLTTGTPEQARRRAEWARARGARFLDGGIMAVPPMIGAPQSGAFIFYSGSRELFDEHRTTLEAPAGATFTGEDPGYASLHDVALLSGMYGMFSGVTHAFALIRNEAIRPTEFAPLLKGWINAMSGSIDGFAQRLESGDYTTDVVSNLAMQVAGIPTFLDTAHGQNVSPELLTPYFTLMTRLLATGAAEEDTTRIIDLLSTANSA
ncbi:NAD(P)-binding domain-containing protein [Streptomycetaceae bacterium NBC_01309]